MTILVMVESLYRWSAIALERCFRLPIRKKGAKAESDPDRKYGDALDYFEEVEEERRIDCPECAKAQRHVQLLKSEGETLECPECHYMRNARRS